MAFYISFPVSLMFQTLFDLYFLILCRRKYGTLNLFIILDVLFCVSGFEDLEECTNDECTLLINWNKKKNNQFSLGKYIYIIEFLFPLVEIWNCNGSVCYII